MNPEDLSRWLAEQRWFAGRGRQITSVHCSPVGTLQREPTVQIHVVTVEYDDGGEEMYQVPVVYRDRPVPELAGAFIGTGPQDKGGAPTFAYDALHDPEVVNAWWAAIIAERVVDGLAFHCEPETAARTVDTPPMVMGGEQTNTSVVFGDVAILKLFRRLTAGPSPDVELSRALQQAGNPYVPAVLGWVDGTWRGTSGEEVGAALGIATEYLASASGAWELALVSLRAWLSESGAVPERSGADFGSESYRLGEAVATIHADLARMLGASTAPSEQIVAMLTQRLAACVAASEELRPYEADIRARYEAIARRESTLPVQRIHGDLHLGQVLRVPAGWRILDFEGEPGTPVADRREPGPPLRDVAGMLRSFDYVGEHLLAGHDVPDGLTVDRARAWVLHNQKSFGEGYAAAGGAAGGPVALEGFLLDKAVYEVVYETRYRPEWVKLPLASIERMLAAPIGA